MPDTPRPSRHDQHAHRHAGAAEDDYTDLLDLDAEVLRDYWSAALDWVQSAAAGAARTRLLDLGAGTGTGAIGLAERFPDAEVIALDVSPVSLAQDRAPRRHAPDWPRRVRPVEADLDAGWPDLGTAGPDLGVGVAAPHGRPGPGAARRARRHPSGRADRGVGVRRAAALPPRRPGLRPARLRGPDRRRARPRVHRGDADPRLGMGAAAGRGRLGRSSPSGTSRSTRTRRRTRAPPGTPAPGSRGCRRGWPTGSSPTIRPPSRRCSTAAAPARC